MHLCGLRGEIVPAGEKGRQVHNHNPGVLAVAVAAELLGFLRRQGEAREMKIVKREPPSTVGIAGLCSKLPFTVALGALNG